MTQETTYPGTRYWAKKLGPVHKYHPSGHGWICNADAVMLGNNWAPYRPDALKCPGCFAAEHKEELFNQMVVLLADFQRAASTPSSNELIALCERSETLLSKVLKLG